MNESLLLLLFFFNSVFYNGIISCSDMMEPSMTVDLCGAEQGFVFPTCPWVVRATKCRLCLSWILCCQQSFQKHLAASGFLPVLHLLLSEDCPACPLHGGVRSAGQKVSLQDPSPRNGYVRTRMIGCQLLLLVNCLSAISRLLQKRKKICRCELVLDKNLQSGIASRCGCGL